ncbi:hypothetical protein [Bacillus cereus]|uniref:hypothetical protein n=1 Tax=Bacillus cereus group TaxID=86661 RepID=UPI00240664F7|nr:hypothetical protein [Bacillus cereus]MDF9530602.1 hypothetical protein [Bacillus cereus]MDG1578876.1 hypothetical protein [Bacillus cereus]
MYFAIRNNTVIPVKLINENKKGTGAWCQGATGKKFLVSYKKLYTNQIAAEKKVSNVKCSKEKLRLKLKREEAEILNVFDKIYKDFGVEIKYTMFEYLSIEKALAYYDYIKREEIRDRLITPLELPSDCIQCGNLIWEGSCCDECDPVFGGEKVI